MSDSEYLYRSMTPNDEEDVRQLCYHYWRFETISRALGLDVPRECERHVEYMLKEGLSNQVSVVAEEKISGQIVGMAIGIIATPDNPQDWIFPADDPDCKKMIKIEKICDSLNITSDYFTLYNVNKLIYGIASTVLVSHQHKGIALGLSKKNQELAQLLDIQLFVMDCTSAYSRKILNKMKYEKKKETLFVDPETGSPLRLPGEDRDIFGSLHVLFITKKSRL